MASTISAGTTAGSAIAISGDTSGSLVLQTNGTTTAVTINTSQNVGIGTTSPSRKLDVSASSAAGSSIEIGNTNTQSSTLAAINTTGTTYSYSGVGGSTSWYYGSKTVALGTDGAYPIQFIANGSERMRIDSSGNVGIGTTSPSSKLSIGTLTETVPATYTGVLKVQGSAQTTLESVGGIELPVAGDGYSFKIQQLSSGGAALVFANRNALATWTERMRIDSSGNVLVGTATNNSRNPRLALNGNSVTWSVGPHSSNSTFVVYNPSEAGVYLPSGNTAWVSTSDERLKNITGEITDAINKVSQLRAAEFTWKSDESNKPQVGLIAQDVQTVLPEAISENDKEFLGVSYTDVIPLLVASIKEQQTIINELKARITALEGLSA